jgi:hypothetical protein
MKAKLPPCMKGISPERRRNWGYWDGVNCHSWIHKPVWFATYKAHAGHPFDPAYGDAFLAGFMGQEHPNTGVVPPEAVRNA